MPSTAHLPIRHAVHAMGTRFELVAHHDNTVLARAAAEAAFDEVLRLHALWSPFEKSSTIAHINARSPQAVRVDRDTLDLLLAAQLLWEQTAGLFDPTVGALMKWWGFRGPGDHGDGNRSELPPPIGMQHVHIDPAAASISIRTPGLELDVGSIGKGAALDAAALILRDAGVEHALLHAGTSSVLAMGSSSPGDGWRVRVGGHPDAPEIVLHNESLSVSAPSGRTIRSGSGELGHILDPRTAKPTSGVALAAVVCPTAIFADAWSTACLISGTPPPASIARWAYVLPS